jgi:RyR domain
VRHESVESIARAIHERWRQEMITTGEPAPTWRDLDDSRKNSSRDQASHIPVHLAKIGCAVAPLGGADTTDFTFTDSEIEQLAAAEHDRWNLERLADGWTLAEEKNVERKETPYLLPWQQLREGYPDIAELDAALIRAMPAILASAGLRIIRVSDAE